MSHHQDHGGVQQPAAVTPPTPALDSTVPSPTPTRPPTPSENESQMTAVGQDTLEKEVAFPLSNGRKWCALLVFVTSLFIDVLSSSAFFVFTAPISEDLGIVFEQQTWIITSYAVSFASFLLFWGRICDLFSAKAVFLYGFGTVGILNLILSFLKDRYSFFVLRALTGVAGACVVPAAYRLIAEVFPPGEQRGRAYTIYGMTGSLANVSGTIIAGVFELIPNGGQMTAWRWFFRMVALVTIPSAIVAHFVIPPHEGGHTLEITSKREKIKAMDLPGIGFMLCAQLLLIMGLTFGATYGWTKASFLAPFIIGALLYPVFFWWESRLPEIDALLPPSIWRIPNVTVLVVFALITLGWWGVNFMPFLELFHQVHGESMLLSAVRTLPEGIAAAIFSSMLVVWPSLTRHPRTPIIISMTMCCGAYALWTQAKGVVGVDYWKWVFPGMVFGSAGMQIVLVATNVGVMQAAPAGREGVIGAILQTSMQTSSVIALSIQAGLFTVNPGGLYNFANVQASWYFELGWSILWLIGFIVFYKPQKVAKGQAMPAMAH